MAEREIVLDVRDLRVDYIGERGIVHAVDGVSFVIRAGEVFGLAGESGSGKSTIALALMRLLGAPAAIQGGSVLYKGTDILGLDDASLRKVRWREIAMVFQSAMNALNPVMRLGDQIADVILRHEKTTKQDAAERVRDLLRMVGIEPARASAYPHELSGGMRQRAVIAIALALKPSLIIMDEPTTALDVVVQREILDEIKDLQRELGFAILFITHDMSLLLELSDRIAIMYAGELVEQAPASSLHEEPAHPYTRGLMDSFPSLDGLNLRLSGIPGAPPDLRHPPSGCRFHERCPFVMSVCRTEVPGPTDLAPNHIVRCHLFDPRFRTGAKEGTA